jgi:hypothetical protein
MSVVRSSKFRHVFGKTVRKEDQYENVQVGAACLVVTFVRRDFLCSCFSYSFCHTRSASAASVTARAGRGKTERLRSDTRYTIDY